MKGLVLAVLIALPVHAQHHIDFARIFPPLQTQRDEYESAMRKLEARRGHVTQSSSAFVAAMDAYNVALEKMKRLEAYLYLRYAVDTRNVELLHAEEALGGDFEKRTAFFRRKLADLSDSQAKRLVATGPAQRYARFVALARDTRSRLSVEQDEIVSALGPRMTDWQHALYETLQRRKEPSRDLYAFALLGLVRARTDLARLRGFPDAASEVYAESGLTRADSRRLFDAVAAEAPRHEAFRRIRVALPPAVATPSYSMEEVPGLLHDALTPLGRPYLDELGRLLNPANGRFDATPGEHRKRGGFSKGFPGMTSVFYMAGFTGTYNDVRVIAHEGTHAVQRELQARNKVAPVYASAPSFVMEALAITAELILPRYLYEHETTVPLKRFFLEQLLTSKGLTVLFQTAAEADLEERIYDGVSRGEIHGASDLDALTVATYARYGMDVSPDQWTKIRLMFEDPFYDINYTWAAVIALPLFGAAQTDPTRFAAQYSHAIGSAFDQPVDTWLKSSFGIDLRDPELVRQALDTIQPYVDALAASEKISAGRTLPVRPRAASGSDPG